MLVLTVTRECNLRCDYCPTFRQPGPFLDAGDVRRSFDLFDELLGSGEAKLSGGEPLLRPETVVAALEESAARPSIRRLWLYTNGTLLDDDWLHRLAAHPKAWLAISIDGTSADHRANRKPLHHVPDSYEQLVSLRSELLRNDRVVVNQVIAPNTAGRAAENFQHLLQLGFRHINLLPGYLLRWSRQRVRDLRSNLTVIGEIIRAEWAAERPLRLRNLTVDAATPFFNSGLVVDADRSIHASNFSVTVELGGSRQTRLGTLDTPPSALELRRRIEAMAHTELTPENVRASTRVVDACLSELCQGLQPEHDRRFGS